MSDPRQLLIWIGDNREKWIKMLDVNKHITPREYIDYINMLRQNGMYETLAIFIANRQEDYGLEEVMTEYAMQYMTENWDDSVLEHICEHLTKSALSWERRQKAYHESQQLES